MSPLWEERGADACSLFEYEFMWGSIVWSTVNGSIPGLVINSFLTVCWFLWNVFSKQNSPTNDKQIQQRPGNTAWPEPPRLCFCYIVMDLLPSVTLLVETSWTEETWKANGPQSCFSKGRKLACMFKQSVWKGLYKQHSMGSVLLSQNVGEKVPKANWYNERHFENGLHWRAERDLAELI